MRMFISRQMRLALLVSFSWHLFWMSFVSMVFLPSGVKSRSYSSVHFLGSILRDPSPGKGGSVEFPLEANIEKENVFYKNPHLTLPVDKAAFNLDGFVDVDVPERLKPFDTVSFSTESSAQREVIFKPAFTEYPEWAQQQFKPGFAAFEVYISAEGLVEQVINLQASGNPEIDAALVRYIVGWRFAPVQRHQGDWQVVKINLDFE